MQWGVHSGPHWELLEGFDSGQTQVDHPEDGEMAVWSHPLDVHYLVQALTGWPKLHFQIWSMDIHGEVDLCKNRKANECCSVCVSSWNTNILLMARQVMRPLYVFL